MNYSPTPDWPQIFREPYELTRYTAASQLGIDFEFDRNTITIQGVSDGHTACATSWNDGKGALLDMLTPETQLIGHNAVQVEMMILADNGIPVQLEKIEDTIIWHWLCNQHLCKAAQKNAATGGGDEDTKRGRGFMNLWSMASLYTSFSNWKDCPTKIFCDDGRPCPRHRPFQYCAMDALAPVVALPALHQRAKLLGVDKLYPLHRELAYYLSLMQRFGVRVDSDYLTTLRADFARAKDALAASLPFNPGSPKQVVAHFKAKGIALDDAQEESIRQAADEHEADDELARLLDWKEIGNGPDRWFGSRYLDKRGYLHPALGIYTSSGRLNCANPNLQNLGKRRVDRSTGENLGKKVRRAIIAPEGHYIVRADLSNGENRVYLYLAGYEAPTTDLHNWMVQNIGLKPEDEFSVRLGSPRDAAKSVTHATDYGEGLQLKEPSDLRSSRIQSEIKAGARQVFPDWKFNGKVVTFTGANLAERAFGSATFENRRKALAIAQRYIDESFPKVRQLQRQIAEQIEHDGYVAPPLHYKTLSYGRDEDRLKQAWAIYGSQPVAHITKLALVQLWRDHLAGRSPVRPFLQMHDEILAYAPNDMPLQEAARAIVNALQPDMPEMPGFKIPSDPSHGPNWAEQKKI